MQFIYRLFTFPWEWTRFFFDFVEWFFFSFAQYIFFSINTSLIISVYARIASKQLLAEHDTVDQGNFCNMNRSKKKNKTNNDLYFHKRTWIS